MVLQIVLILFGIWVLLRVVEWLVDNFGLKGTLLLPFVILGVSLLFRLVHLFMLQLGLVD